MELLIILLLIILREATVFLAVAGIVKLICILLATMFTWKAVVILYLAGIGFRILAKI